MAVATKKNSTPIFKAHSTSLKSGDKAPDFKALDQQGTLRSLKDFPGQELVLYFYPKDNTPTCTTQACNLRDDYKTLTKAGYTVLGISADDETSHAKFANKYALPYPLLADTEMTMIKAYDVWGTKMLFGKIKDGIVRTTFVIGKDGLIKHVVRDVNSKEHAQQILALGKNK